MEDYLRGLFENKDLLAHALTHRSWVNEHKGVRTSNERLEFLGDAVLELIVSRVLFDKFPDKEEGYLTVLRSNIVNTTNLAHAARALEIGPMLHLSKGESAVGRTKPSLLADTMEAVIGALYLDRGLTACEEFIQKHLLSDLEMKIRTPLKGPKSILQEYVQERGMRAPQYRVVGTSGPDHAKVFEVEVLVDGKSIARAKAKSKGRATQAAAESALLRMGVK